MVFSEAYKKVTNWLTSSGVEMESGRLLDSQGCCLVSQGEDRECVIMLPSDQTTLYFISTLYTPELDTDNNLMTFCLCLNSFSLGFMQTAAIGLDVENRQIILRSAHPLQNSSITNFDHLLNEFLDQASLIREQIRTFRQTDGDTENASYPNARDINFEPSNSLRA